MSDLVPLTETQHQLADLQESVATLERALAGDIGWQQTLTQADVDFSHDGLMLAADLCRVMAVKNPLIRRGLALRAAYVWGSGVTVTARVDEGGQDVDSVVQSFLADPGNQRVFSSADASLINERALGTDGNVFFVCFTNAATGRVQVRKLNMGELVGVHTNPDDVTEPWFYRRVWTVQERDQAGRVQSVRKVALYPDLGHRPAQQPARLDVVEERDPVEVRWDSPVLHVGVNRLDGWTYGIGDAYPAIDWARAYKEFLEDWARLCKALSRFAWQTTTTGARTAKVAAALAAVPTAQPLTGGLPERAGATVVHDGSSRLEAIPKTGATLDSESGRPLAAMVAAALDVPVTMLLGDPGLTGSRATAETLDRPTELMAEGRRRLWTDTLTTLVKYAVECSARAPKGLLRGEALPDLYTGEPAMVLDGPVPEYDIAWPPLEDTDPAALVQAIVLADSTGKMPPRLVAVKLMEALGVEDPETWADEMLDEQGRWVDPSLSPADVAVDAFRRGEDPADLLNQ